MKKRKLSSIKNHLLEFLLVGVLFGIIEDIIAIYSYGGIFTIKTVYIAAIVAIPFAIVSELIIDWSELLRIKV